MRNRARALALVLVLAAARVNPQAFRAFAEFEEEKHPRDDHGKFTSGGPGEGSPKKEKAAAATKDQIAKVVELKKAGHSYAHIHAQTGINPKQAATIVFKINKAQKAIEEKAKTPTTSVAAKPTPPPPLSGADAAKQAADPLKTAPIASALPVPGSAAAQASAYGYKWQEKKFGPSAGKYAWFKDDIQVSSPMESTKSVEAAATMHNGAGPKAPEQKVPVAPAADGWPLHDGVPRSLGSNFPKEMDKLGNGWSATLTASEWSAVVSYTGSAYSDINAQLRSGQTLSTEVKGRVDNINTALAKAPAPPPPELVWRGISSNAEWLHNAKVGDTLKLNGFQSASIKPTFAHSWGGGKRLYEIKPKVGAYVRVVSMHQHEYEYLLPHGSQYRVRGITAVKFEGHSDKVTVVQLEML